MRTLSFDWRRFFAILPLPMLGLAASYGVYRFALMFVPAWVAVVQAGAFEATYLGLALVQVDELQRRRAQYIGAGAVIVSILYNSIDGLFHLRPALLVGRPLWADVALAVLHGAPLAWVSYLVANLLLHAESTPYQKGLQSSKVALVSQPVVGSDTLLEADMLDADALVGGREAEYTLDDFRALLGPLGSVIRRRDVVEQLGCSTATASRLLGAAVDAGLVDRNGVGYKSRG
jgi:hypothetical protein